MTTRSCRRCGQNFHPSRDYHLCCWACYSTAHEDAGEAHKHAAPFNVVEIRWILQQVHPDKHSNSTVSNRVTAELLRMRAEVRS